MNNINLNQVLNFSSVVNFVICFGIFAQIAHNSPVTCFVFSFHFSNKNVAISGEVISFLGN